MTTQPQAPAEIFDKPTILGNNAIPSMLDLEPAKRVLNADLARFLAVIITANTAFKSPALTALVAQLEFAQASTDSATRKDAIAMADALAGGMKLNKPQTILSTGLNGDK